MGGCVRDLILGEHPKDFDIATSATPQRVKSLVRRAFIIGKRFKIVVAKRRPKLEEVHSHDIFPPLLRSGKIAEKEIQITTFRREPEMQGGKLNENVFGSAKDDAFRRDFTVNGLFLDPINGEIVDHVDGLKDLDSKTLRIIGDPKDRFHEDPIRILRAIRFCVRSDFQLESKTQTALEEEISCLKEAKQERIREELLKFLKEGTASKGFEMLWNVGAWPYLSPTWNKFLKEHEDIRETFFQTCGSIDAKDWHPSFGVAPLFFIFLYPLTLLPKSESNKINQVLRGTAEDLKISKVEKEEIQFLHKNLMPLKSNPEHSFKLQKRKNFILKQLQYTLTLSFLRNVDSSMWETAWQNHKAQWMDHLGWVKSSLQDDHQKAKRSRYGARSPSKNRRRNNRKPRSKSKPKTQTSS